MAACTKNLLFAEAIELFERLLHFPYLKPDSYTYPSVLKACGGLGRGGYGQMVHTHVIKSGIFTDIVIASSVVGMYAKCEMFGSALQLFVEMPERDVACWNTVISGYYHSGQCEKALELFEKMKDLGFEPNSVTITTAISSCARLLDLERGKRIHNGLTENGFVLDGFVSAALVDMYGKCGCLEMAVEVFDQMPMKSLVSWNSIIAGYSLIGDSNSCIELFKKMNEEGVKPTSTTLSSLLIACSRSANLQFGKFVHGYVIRNCLEADIFVSSSLLDLYFKCSYFVALRIFNDLKEAGVKPDAITFTTILTACSRLAALEQGEEIARFLIEKDPDDPSTYIVLANMYASVKRWDEARKVRLKMKVLGLKKNPGCSWIEVGKRIQPFFVEDTSHPEAELVYDCLASLSVHMEKDELELN
ncbi:tetratricopeptide repeat (TPR)-like superfamily protein [Actinidia rufa]|uniref:Tetratricopeptide repeat (TPR)-like superfamily protein n=1 Tax=Actinidia rufa TaxID=165716 RepID=A0A7J0HBZ3_9ERIC|nr:tetratricopeptide repeat (TPR)-like superfamily protein [Actinidia rufa]